MTIDPALNVTDPVGTPELPAGRLTVAWSVTVAGMVTGFGDALKVTVVGALPTLTLLLPLLAAKLPVGV